MDRHREATDRAQVRHVQAIQRLVVFQVHHAVHCLEVGQRKPRQDFIVLHVQVAVDVLDTVQRELVRGRAVNRDAALEGFAGPEGVQVALGGYLDVAGTSTLAIHARYHPCSKCYCSSTERQFHLL